jgi:hypothetical protein
VPFTLRNLKEDPEDVGSNFDGSPDLEFRLATEALELEKSGLGYQRVRPVPDEATRPGPRASRSSSSAHPISARPSATTAAQRKRGGIG